MSGVMVSQASFLHGLGQHSASSWEPTLTSCSLFCTVPSPSALLVDNPTPFGNAKEVIAIKDYCPTNFTTLKFSKGDHLYVLDTSGGEWWYAHNTTEMGYIPSSYVQP